MDILASLQTVNYLAVLVATVVSMIIGALWFSRALFGKIWAAGVGLTDAELNSASRSKMMVGSFVLTFIVATSLALLVGGTGLLSSVQVSLLLGVGLLATTRGIHFIYEQKSLQHYLVTVGYDLVVLVVMGATIGTW